MTAMTRLLLALLTGLAIGMHVNLWSHADFRAHAIAALGQVAAAGPYVARAVTELEL